MGLSDQLKDFGNAIGAALTDLTTIDVATYTGSVTLDVVPEVSSLDATTIFNKLKGAAGGKLKLVALTHVEIDMDATNVVAEDADAKLFALHADAVKAALDARAAVVSLVKGLL